MFCFFLGLQAFGENDCVVSKPQGPSKSMEGTELNCKIFLPSSNNAEGLVTYQLVPNFYITSSRGIRYALDHICVFTPWRQSPKPSAPNPPFAAPNLPNDSFVVEVWALAILLCPVTFATMPPAELEVGKTPGHIVVAAC